LFLELTALNRQNTTVRFKTAKFGKMCFCLNVQQKKMKTRARDITV